MILICDDDIAIRSSLSLVLRRAGYEVELAESPEKAMEIIRKTDPQLVLMDMNYTTHTDGEEGLVLLQQVKIYKPNVPVILITAWGSISLAVRGIQTGAFDFITKPWNNLALLKSIDTAIQLNQEKENNLGENETNEKASPILRGNIIGESSLLKNIFEVIKNIAKTNASVLITGESGTGKELIAEAIHQNSNRKSEAFVKVNLGGISQSLFESEMFGHKKGAFTDAHYDRIGRFEMAHKGTVFLDEIGDLDSVCQVKLLRVLQDQTFERLGDSQTKQVDVRVVSATNRNLTEMVANNSFREDLFYRINLITIQLPALRERREDIPLLVNHFLKNLTQTNGMAPTEVSSEGMQYLMGLPYPGNIRELKNFVERTLLVSNKRILTDIDLKKQYIETTSPNVSHNSLHSIDEMEKQMIEKAMKLYGGNLSKVATTLGLSRQALYRRIEKYNIEKE